MILKVATGVQSDGTINWKDLYANAIRLRLRRDKNLSDVGDAKESRDNLGVTKAIADAEQEAIDISVEYARKNDSLIWTRLDERMSAITEDIYYLKENIGTWNYIDYESRVVEDLNFVDYTKVALQDLFQEIGNNDVALRQYVDDVSDDTYRKIIVQQDLHYESLNDLVKIWWEMFQDNLKRDINILQRDIERSDAETKLKISALEAYCDQLKNNFSALGADLTTADNRITKLRDKTQNGLQDLFYYTNDVIAALTEYMEEVVRAVYGQIKSYVDAQVASLDAKITALSNSVSAYPSTTSVATKSWVTDDFLPNYIPKVWNSEGKLEFFYKGNANGQVANSSNSGTKKATAATPHDVLWIDN